MSWKSPEILKYSCPEKIVYCDSVAGTVSLVYPVMGLIVYKGDGNPTVLQKGMKRVKLTILY